MRGDVFYRRLFLIVAWISLAIAAGFAAPILKG
jgi:hypothetical protein